VGLEAIVINRVDFAVKDALKARGAMPLEACPAPRAYSGAARRCLVPAAKKG